MFTSVKETITCDASGNAEVYLSHGLNRKPNGYLAVIKYTPGTIAGLADITITGESSGIPIMSKTDAGTGIVFYYPRAFPNAVADGAAGTVASERIPIKDERIKVVVAQGGSGGVGTIEAIIETDTPY